MFDYTLIRSDRKTLGIEIDRGGNLIVRAPRRLDQATIEGFLESRAKWIEEKRRLVLERRAAVVAENQDDLQNVWFLGKQYRLRRQDALRVDFTEDEMVMPRSWQTAHLRAWLKAACQLEIQRRVPLMAPLMQLRPTGMHVTEAKTRWGSCSSKNSLNFSWRLIFCPPEVISYVVIHELCHIKHKDHSAAFWAMVAQYDPKYESRKAWLQSYAALMDLF